MGGCATPLGHIQNGGEFLISVEFRFLCLVLWNSEAKINSLQSVENLAATISELTKEIYPTRNWDRNTDAEEELGVQITSGQPFRGECRHLVRYQATRNR